MKLLADENVKRRLVRWLEAQGHAVTVPEKGSKDFFLFELARERGETLLTNDTDFLNTALYPLKDTPGRIVLRVFPPILKNQITGLAAVLGELSEHEYQGALIEVWKNGFEIRSE